MSIVKRSTTMLNENKKLAKLGYRPDVDGLRGISVLLVLLFHTGEIVSGGFVGVDVFFVISGFLITSIICYEIQEEKFLLRKFWSKRIRRILPASLACILGTLVLSGIVMLPNDYISTAKSAFASAIACGNVFFWRDGGYFAGPSETKPFLHFWSLAVEEQFYLFYPLLLVALFRVRRASVAKILLAIAVASFVVSVLGVYYKPTATFYLLPTRAWELLIGGVLALTPVADLKRGKAELLSVLGILMILIPAFAFDSQTPFPGIAAAVPCLGAILLIRAHSSANEPLGKKLLEFKPLVFVGVISYSLYLWHWPVLALMKYCLIEISFLTGLYAIVASFALAYLSWRYVEQRFRARPKDKLAKSQNNEFWRPILWGLSGTLCLLLLSSLIVLADGFGSRFKASIQPNLDDAVWHGRSLRTTDGKTDFPRIGDTSSTEDQFLVWGDSHAMMMSEVVSDTAQKCGVAGRFVSVPGAPPLPNIFRNHGKKPPSARTNEIIQYIVDNQIPNVILIARWSAYSDGYTLGDLRFEERGKSVNDFIIGDDETIEYGKEDGRRVLKEKLTEIVTELQNSGTQVWLVQQIPEQNGPTALPLLLEKHLSLSARYYPATWEDNQKRQSHTNATLSEMKKLGAFVLETHDLCFDADLHPILVHEGRACYNDNDHLTRYGASHLLETMFLNVMRQVSSHPESVASGS